MAQTTRAPPRLISIQRPLREAADIAPEAKGVVLYRGESPFVTEGDRAYVVILTFNSDNRKTGDMAQVWIIAENESPLEARKLGLYQIVCGDCPVVAACYVNLAHRPRTLYTAFQRGDYPEAFPQLYGAVVASKGVRFGAYGDPVLIPLPLVEELVDLSGRRFAGYTHQWRRPEYQGYRPYFMASCETLADAELATEMGWRWYLVTLDETVPGAVLCPHQNAQHKYEVKCNTCWACNGANRPVGARQRTNIIARPTGHNNIAARWRKQMEKQTA